MKFLKLIPILFIFFGNFPYKNVVQAEIKNPKDFNVLLNEKMIQEEEKALKNLGR